MSKTQYVYIVTNYDKLTPKDRYKLRHWVDRCPEVDLDNNRLTVNVPNFPCSYLTHASMGAHADLQFEEVTT